LSAGSANAPTQKLADFLAYLQTHAALLGEAASFLSLVVSGATTLNGAAMGGARVTAVADPVGDQDAATKHFALGLDAASRASWAAADASALATLGPKVLKASASVHTDGAGNYELSNQFNVSAVGRAVAVHRVAFSSPVLSQFVVVGQIALPSISTPPGAVFYVQPLLKTSDHFDFSVYRTDAAGTEVNLSTTEAYLEFAVF
jgi:hypothetical protein